MHLRHPSKVSLDCDKDLIPPRIFWWADVFLHTPFLYNSQPLLRELQREQREERRVNPDPKEEERRKELEMFGGLPPIGGSAGTASGAAGGYDPYDDRRNRRDRSPPRGYGGSGGGGRY